MTDIKDYSQWGEQAILIDIFNRIGVKNGLLVDIGAWDGYHFSNTAYFRETLKWRCLLAEADPERLQKLSRLKDTRTRIHGRVTNIDLMLAELDWYTNLDLLCIDIDGDDYYLWEDMVEYRPRVVVIEYNQTVPPHLDIKQKRGGTFGASYAALRKLGHAKGYHLVSRTTTNLIFVLTTEMELSGIRAHYLVYPIDFKKIQWLQYVVTGYNGKQYLIGKPAHNDNQNGQHEDLIFDGEIVRV